MPLARYSDEFWAMVADEEELLLESMAYNSQFQSKQHELASGYYTTRENVWALLPHEIKVSYLRSCR